MKTENTYKALINWQLVTMIKMFRVSAYVRKQLEYKHLEPEARYVKGVISGLWFAGCITSTQYYAYTNLVEKYVDRFLEIYSNR